MGEGVQNGEGSPHTTQQQQQQQQRHHIQSTSNTNSSSSSSASGSPTDDDCLPKNYGTSFWIVLFCLVITISWLKFEFLRKIFQEKIWPYLTLKLPFAKDQVMIHNWQSLRSPNSSWDQDIQKSFIFMMTFNLTWLENLENRICLITSSKNFIVQSLISLAALCI